MLLNALANVLVSHRELGHILHLEGLIIFCDVVYWLKDEIVASQRAHLTTPPPTLPFQICNFLADVLCLSEEDVGCIWGILRDVAWTAAASLQDGEVHGSRRAQALLPLFLKYGCTHGVSFYTFRPPTRVCCEPTCSHQGRFPKSLVEPLSHEAVAFTRDMGPLPAKVVSLYCRSCHSRYYHNYYVHSDASTRTYYGGPVPEFIQITQHSFIAREVCEMFATLMNVSWTSATNCSKFYNLSLAKVNIDALLPPAWKLSHTLSTENVWDAFLTYALILDHHERGTVLELKHNAPSHAERLRPALQARNALMVGPGQEQWSHACDLCCWVQEAGLSEAPEAVRSVVTDGVAIGHPCCGVHDCKIPLLRTKGARYCAEHSSKEHECSVTDCTLPVEGAFKTCTLPAHRAMDDSYHLKNSAMFQLRDRLQRLSTAHHRKTLVPDTLELPVQSSATPLESSLGSSTSSSRTLTQPIASEGDLYSSETLPAEVSCDVKSPEGNRRLHALFGRRRTHNEELCVTSCGVILGRATFFGSEAINGVLAFWQRLFPTRASLPQVHWHDQNCRVWAVLNNAPAETREFFANVALPVDVFHFKCKHKESDIVCGTHCNPYIWPELRTPEGKWRFNSSAAEQCNVWFGKFQAMVREMDVDRYNFFLDEMVKRRNRLVVQQLERQGHHPYLIPRAVLLNVDV